MDPTTNYQERVQSLELRVANLDCDSDAAKIERGLQRASGIKTLRVYPKSAKVAVTYTQETTPEKLKEQLGRLGFPVQEGRAMPEQPAFWRNPKVLTSLASGALLLAGWLLGFTNLELVPTLLFWSAIAVGGYYFGREALEELFFEREVGIELLMTIAALAAALLGQVLEGAMLVFLYSISEALEGYTEAKTRSAVKALMDLAPKMALVRRDGREVEVPVEALEVGEVFIVRPGQAVATDGEVLRGSSSVNQAPVTGESVPVPKEEGGEVFAGSINGEGVLEVKVTRSFGDNTISRIIHLVEEAQEKKGQGQRFIERFGSRYSPVVLLVGVLLALVPPLLFGASWDTWLVRATIFIVAAAPCALVISIPITMVAALGTGARQGVLVKGGLYLEELSKVRVVALDKTGTLTRGEPEVTDVVALDGRGERELLATAAGVERYSQHPLARAVLRYAEAQGVPPAAAEDFQSLTGAGASARVNGEPVYIGSPDLFSSRFGLELEAARGDIERLQEAGKTVVLVGDERRVWGLLAIRDNLRANARSAVSALHDLGVKVVMLTGDNQRTGAAIAREAGVDEVFADLKPEGKVERVRELDRRYGHVVMVGDGVNDAPALAEATAGVAMGAAGTDVAMETADVVLMADDLEKLVYALKLARRTQAVVNQNLALSAVVIAVLVVGAVGGWFTLPVAVLGHEISEFVVVGSGLRMLRA